MEKSAESLEKCRIAVYLAAMGWVFGEYELDDQAFELRRDSEPIPAEPQVLSLLCLLIENRDRLVTKDEIVDQIWDGRAISDAAISSRIKSARQLIGDDGKQQSLIRTVHGRGFRFVGEVAGPIASVPESTEQTNQNDSLGGQLSSGKPNRRILYAGLFGLACIAVLGIFIAFFGNPSGRWAPDNDGATIAVLPFTAPQDEAVGREIAASIVTELSDRTDFTMLSSTSSFSLSDQGLTAADITRETGATHILEGDLRGSGEQQRLDLRLVEGESQQQIWTGTVRSYPTDANNVSNRAILLTAAAIQAFLEVGGGKVEIPDGTSPDAIREFRRGIETELSFSNRDPRLSQQRFFDAARKSAPNWADAHGAFAWSTLFARPETLALSFEDQHALIHEAIARSKELDPDNRWARLTEAVHKTRYGTDFSEALALHKDLAHDEPSWPLARKMYAQALLLGGHYREALAEFDQIDAMNALRTHNGNFVRTSALRGIGRPMNSRALALACELRCFWFFHGWYEAILLKEHSSQQELEADLVEFTSELLSIDPEGPVREIGFPPETGDMMSSTARFLKGYGPRPENPFGLVLVPALVATADGDLDAATTHLEQLSGDWIPANAIFELLYDDRLQTPERLRSDPRYRAIMSRPHFQAVLNYRRERGLIAGLPTEN